MVQGYSAHKLNKDKHISNIGSYCIGNRITIGKEHLYAFLAIMELSYISATCKDIL